MLVTRKTVFFYWTVLKDSVVKFIDDDIQAHAAALSYYMIFSLPSMLLIVLWLTAQLYDEEAVRQAIFTEIGRMVGEGGAQQLMGTIDKFSIQKHSAWAGIVGLAVLLFFATSVFAAMRSSLNHVMQVKTAVSVSRGILSVLRARVIAFAMLISMSFILLVSMVVDALITATSNFLVSWIGDAASVIVFFDFLLLDLFTSTIIFAIYLRYLPDNRFDWRDVWFGALLTAVLIAAGKYAIAVVIGSSDVANVYDAAGSVLVIMLWVYYTSAIFLFGAVFTFNRAKMLNRLDCG
jgi:membrane protein